MLDDNVSKEPISGPQSERHSASVSNGSISDEKQGGNGILKDDMSMENVHSIPSEEEVTIQERGIMGRIMKSRRRMEKRYGPLYPYVIISIAYLCFTVTDGAIKMIVLLHAFQNNFSALDVAIVFSFYEAAGVVTNLLAGLLGARWGIKTTLLSGLTIQLVAFAMLFGWKDSWSIVEAIIYVTVSQTLSGVAKDLTKLGGKTVTKLVTPEGKNSKLFKLVSLITGWKNSLKGVGYFIGAALVSVKCVLIFVC